MSYKMFDPISKEGYLFVGVLIVATFIAFAISWGLGVLSLLTATGCAFFFRDPIRVVPINKDLVLSPADGTIYNIDRDRKDGIRISIFLSIMNVHVNRIPISGTIQSLKYNPGKFVRASSHKDSEDNERQDIIVKTESGTEITFSQIAGFISRRIVCNLKEGEQVTAGKRFGIIKFGSRMDVIVPKDVSLLVAEGQTVIGGETRLADLAKKYKTEEYTTE
ncbi:MAG: phosphatidylserine decarboxylase family protein [Rickettsiaceae bacterium H1]|nr:phosphatidylserine decarboxylase family protein [Rickettsiaceae bacterium H1]